MLQERLARAATTLSDEELASAIRTAERRALCMTRSMRDLARMRLRSLECELERRECMRVGGEVLPARS
jgi:hypothetical protein